MSGPSRDRHHVLRRASGTPGGDVAVTASAAGRALVGGGDYARLDDLAVGDALQRGGEVLAAGRLGQVVVGLDATGGRAIAVAVGGLGSVRALMRPTRGPLLFWLRPHFGVQVER